MSASKRKQGDRLNAFDKTEIEQVADDIFGASAAPEFNTGRVVARPISIEEIWADVRQPRRVIPASIRLVWNGSPADVPRLLETWASVAANSVGRTIDLQAIINGDGEGLDTDGTPAIYESFIALLRLAGSILRDGLINPITIIDQRDRHLIESGERRWLAYWLLRLYTQAADEFARIPAVMASGADFVWRQAAENTARRSLNAVGMARQLALLIMAARGADQYHDYDQIVLPGGSDRRFYAQIADGNVHRIPKGAGERIQAAMGLSESQLAHYRRLLRVTDDDEINDQLWLRADIEDWSENAFRPLYTFTVVKVREILSRDGWSLDDFRAAVGALREPPSPPPPAPPAPSVGTRHASSESGGDVPLPQRVGNVDLELARRILSDIRQGFARVYAIEDSPNPDEQTAANRATRLLNQAQGFYERNRMESAQESLNEAFHILDEAAAAADKLPAGNLSTPPSGGTLLRPAPNTHDPYMTRIYHNWRNGYRADDLLLITQDGEVYIAIANDDANLRNLRRRLEPGGIGLSGSADYTLVTKISAELLGEIQQEYKGAVLTISYADLDDDMQYVAGVALRARNIPLNISYHPPAVIPPPASDNGPSAGSDNPVVDRTTPLFTLLGGLQTLATSTNQPDAVETVAELLGMTWGTARQLAEKGQLTDAIQLHFDNINNALSAWSQFVSDFLNNLHEQITEE